MRTYIDFVCDNCGIFFQRERKQCYKKRVNTFCSRNCGWLFATKSKEVICLNCSILFTKTLSQLKKHPNSFCSSSCAATYNNKHKTKGTRRSKLEVWIEEQLKIMYPALDILFNEKKSIGSELDIFIPLYNFAIELNGIFHYRPIYGEKKFFDIISNDFKKSNICSELGIDLLIIDVSSLGTFSPERGRKYLKLITDSIEEKIKN